MEHKCLGREKSVAYGDKQARAEGAGWQAFKKMIKGKRPISREEEASLFKEVDRGNKATALMEGALSDKAALALIPGWDSLDANARRVRLGELKARGKKAKERLWEAGLKQALFLAEQYSRRLRGVAGALSEEDLYQEGSLSIGEAVERFDPKLGLRFCSYAEPAIRRAMRRAIENKGRCVRIPVWQQEESGRISREREALACELKREPTQAELAKRLGISQVRLERLAAAGLSEASLDAPLGEDGEATLGDFILSEAESPEAAYERKEMNALAAELFASLSEKERFVVKLYRGFGCKRHSHAEIAPKLNLSREGARKVYLRAQRKLRLLARARGMDAFLEGA